MSAAALPFLTPILGVVGSLASTLIGGALQPDAPEPPQAVPPPTAPTPPNVDDGTNPTTAADLAAARLRGIRRRQANEPGLFALDDPEKSSKQSTLLGE